MASSNSLPTKWLRWVTAGRIRAGRASYRHSPRGVYVRTHQISNLFPAFVSSSVRNLEILVLGSGVLDM